MIGLILGLACGVAELMLLRVLVDGIASGSVRLWVVPAKLGALALFFVPCAVLWPVQLYLCGIGAAVVLVAGSVVMVILGGRKNKARQNETETGAETL